MNLVIAKWSLVNVYHNGKRSTLVTDVYKSPIVLDLLIATLLYLLNENFQVQDSHLNDKNGLSKFQIHFDVEYNIKPQHIPHLSKIVQVFGMYS